MRGYSLVVAASNHPEALDRALFRRFDDIIEYSMPTATEIEQVFRQRLASEDTKSVKWKEVLSKARGLSLADAARVADDAVKERLIEHVDVMTTALLISAINDRVKQYRALRTCRHLNECRTGIFHVEEGLNQAALLLDGAHEV